MNEALTTLRDTEGVLGYALFDAHHNCLESYLPPPYEPTLLASVLQELTDALVVFASVDDPDAMSSYVARCEQGCFALRRFQGHTVVALTEPRMNLAMLSVAFNVARLKLAKSPPPAPPSPAPTASPPPLQPPPLPPEDLVGLEILTGLLSLLEHRIGAPARRVLDESLAELGSSAGTLVRDRYRDLANKLARHVPHEHARLAFHREAMKLLEQPDPGEADPGQP